MSTSFFQAASGAGKMIMRINPERRSEATESKDLSSMGTTDFTLETKAKELLRRGSPKPYLSL
jgi:hypothetical protein